MNYKSVHVIVSGKVQGVCFRAETRKAALQEEVTGWVKNLPDGRVEAIFEGNPAAVEAMVRWCHQGSPAAEVATVEVADCQPQQLTEFQIR